MKLLLVFTLTISAQCAFAAPIEVTNYLNQYNIQNCVEVRIDSPKFGIKRGDVVKIISSKLGKFEVSRPITTAKEVEQFCRQHKHITRIGWLNGDDFVEWPKVLLTQADYEILEKCFIIDGPANVRERPNSGIVAILKDYQVSKVMQQDGDWLLISKPIEPLAGDDYYFPLRCFTSTKLEPLGWTHKNNLKYFPTPFIQNTSKGVMLLNIVVPVYPRMGISDVGSPGLSINLFTDNNDNPDYIGGAVIYNGDSYSEDAFIFNEVTIKSILHTFRFLSVSPRGFIGTTRTKYFDDGSCEDEVMLIHPSGKSEIIERVHHHQGCGAG